MPGEKSPYLCFGLGLRLKPRRGNAHREQRWAFCFGGPGLSQPRLSQFRGLTSCTPKNQPSRCCAPAEGQNVTDLAQNDLGGEDLGEY